MDPHVSHDPPGNAVHTQRMRGVSAHRDSPWVHLRLCLTCGHVGCCDSSPHAPRTRPRLQRRPSDRAVLPARRRLALVLRRRRLCLSGRRTRQPAEETPDTFGAYPRLDSAPDRTPAPSRGRRTAPQAGDVLIAEGKPPLTSSWSRPESSRRTRRTARRNSAGSRCMDPDGSSANSACWPATRRS